mmetsp:Transcript_4325/g.9357  ORF Transcript_4325/g.9357 Transcript_4325/m.9357 type:complete len:82 (+) Transcript_4325:709-954(+)
MTSELRYPWPSEAPLLGAVACSGVTTAGPDDASGGRPKCTWCCCWRAGSVVMDDAANTTGVGIGIDIWDGSANELAVFVAP